MIRTGTTSNLGRLCRLYGRMIGFPPTPGIRMLEVSSVTGGPKGFGTVMRAIAIAG